jgi:hypothetical protein
MKAEIEAALVLLKDFRRKFPFAENPDSIDSLKPDDIFKINPDELEISSIMWGSILDHLDILQFLVRLSIAISECKLKDFKKMEDKRPDS